MNYCFALLKALPLLFAVLAFPGAVRAQTYPAKTVRVIVPFPPGAGIDTVARLFTPKLTEAMGQSFVVDNRGGAAGNIGAEAAARAAPDGYTLLAATASLASSQSLYKDLRFDLARDFVTVALFATTPYVLGVHPSVPAKSVAELIALAKARPGQLTYASTGYGSMPHLTAEMFKMQAGINILHVPYKGSATAVPDLIGGQVSMMFSSTVLAPVKAGRLRGLAMTSAKRSLAAPDLPTVAESGFPGFESGTWFALFAPAGTPREIVTRLNAAVTKIGQMPEIRDKLLASLGAEPMGGTLEEVGAFVRSEIAKWGKVVAATGVRAE
ncbi:MAG: tripartite tricarboxylate transporter substrate binding protein [Betaproteobacteria bacterium]|nr:tripartite tricarboxylate transporter substrate binding protein [Betaproteobacteria bacterium]